MQTAYLAYHEALGASLREQKGFVGELKDWFTPAGRKARQAKDAAIAALRDTAEAAAITAVDASYLADQAALNHLARGTGAPSERMRRAMSLAGVLGAGAFDVSADVGRRPPARTWTRRSRGCSTPSRSIATPSSCSGAWPRATNSCPPTRPAR